jgi:hypothetical protein
MCVVSNVIVGSLCIDNCLQNMIVRNVDIERFVITECNGKQTAFLPLCVCCPLRLWAVCVLITVDKLWLFKR